MKGWIIIILFIFPFPPPFLSLSPSLSLCRLDKILSEEKELERSDLSQFDDEDIPSTSMYYERDESLRMSLLF